MNETRSLLVVWYLPLLAGILPVLLLGFAYSALADRIVFVPWALAVAACYVVLLRHGIEAGWGRGQLAGALLLTLALGFAAFAWLARAHHEILDLGFRAVLPRLYRPAATAPRTFAALAGALLLAGGAALALGRRRRA